MIKICNNQLKWYLNALPGWHLTISAEYWHPLVIVSDSISRCDFYISTIVRWRFLGGSTAEPRFNEVPGDWGNWFVTTRVRYIGIVFHTFTITGLKNSVRCTENIVISRFVKSRFHCTICTPYLTTSMRLFSEINKYRREINTWSSVFRLC